VAPFEGETKSDEQLVGAFEYSSIPLIIIENTWLPLDKLPSWSTVIV